MLNKCVFGGRFVDEPKLFIGENSAKAIFTLAVDRDKKNDDGERTTDFLNFVAWGNNAKFVERYFHKGDLIMVSSRAQVRIHTDNYGVRHRDMEFVVEDVYFGQNKKKGE